MSDLKAHADLVRRLHYGTLLVLPNGADCVYPIDGPTSDNLREVGAR
ncbi:hypothetical protein L3Q67_38840 [Saccharothrix sp. AJ9571]|nr:hypothetical protein L3Q67_38840 [Saccharothrix sp. AJ9571]